MKADGKLQNTDQIGGQVAAESAKPAASQIGERNILKSFQSRADKRTAIPMETVLAPIVVIPPCPRNIA